MKKFVPEPDEGPRPEDELGIKTTRVGTITQDGKVYTIRAGIALLTPELAARLRERIGRIQRRKRTPHLESMKRDAASGNFVFTGEPILLSSIGEMIDGGHRCTVCIETGCTLMCLFVFGIPESSYRGINVTAKRTGADTLAISGYKDPIVLSALALWIYRWQHEDLLGNVPLSPTEIDEIVAKNPSIGESITKTFGTRVVGVPHAFAAFCHHLFSGFDPDSADDFFGRLITDTGHEEGSPILALRRKLLKPETSVKMLTRRQLIGSFFKAWNFYREGRHVTRIVFAIDEAIPELI